MNIDKLEGIAKRRDLSSQYSNNNIANSLRNKLNIKSDLDTFYERVDERLQKGSQSSYTLKEAEDLATKAYLINEAKSYHGNKSEMALNNGLDRKTIRRNLNEQDIDADVFSPMAYNNATEDQQIYLTQKRTYLEKELGDIVSPYKTNDVAKIVKEELGTLKSANESLYNKLSEQIGEDFEGIAKVVNYTIDKKDDNPNAMFLNAIYASTLKEAQDIVRQKVVDQALQRNDGDLDKTAEELDTSVKTVRRIRKKIENTQNSNIYMMYANQNETPTNECKKQPTQETPEDLFTQLNRQAAKEQLAPTFEDIPVAENGKAWKSTQTEDDLFWKEAA